MRAKVSATALKNTNSKVTSPAVNAASNGLLTWPPSFSSSGRLLAKKGANTAASTNSAIHARPMRAPIPYSPKDYLRDKGAAGLQAPLADPARPHLMGTDESGADVFSRMIHASRIALGLGFVATGIALVLGVFIGGLMGYFSGIVDMVGMRLVETFEAVPTLFLLLTFVAFFGANLYMMMVIIGLTGWTGYTRFVRA